jgi:DNA primase
MRTMPFAEAADLIKSSIDIVDVVSRHVVLKKAGRNYQGLCPFHPEKTPSFSVNREKNLFKCFGCGEAGDALSFLMKRENQTYSEVIREMALDQGIQILSEGHSPEQAAQQQDKKQLIYDLNQATLKWFQGQLASDAGASTRHYLANRGMSDALIQSFGLGYAPLGWENLTPYLMHQFPAIQQNAELLDEAGLANKRVSGTGGLYDRFRNRLMIPILDEQGRAVGFGGRALSDEDAPKYLNSPETPVYIKSRILYGLFQAKDAIRQSGYALVMEGYFDVISAHEAGLTQSVGVCGTALTEFHLKLLSRYGAQTVYLVFDSDEAGQKAALSAIELIEPYLSSSQIKLKVVQIPQGKDPDGFIRQVGPEQAPAAFQQLLTQAQSHLEYKFSQALKGLDASNQEGRIAGVNRITPLLVNIKQPVLRSEMIRLLSSRLRVSEEALTQEVSRQERLFSPVKPSFSRSFQKKGKKEAIFNKDRRSYKGHSQTDYSNQGSPYTESWSDLQKPLHPRHLAAEKSLLRFLFLNNESYQVMLTVLPKISFTQIEHCAILDAVKRFAVPEQTLESFLSSLQTALSDDSDTLKALTEIAMTADGFLQQYRLEDASPDTVADKVRHEAETLIRILEQHQRQERLKTLAMKAQHLEQTTQTASPDETELSLLELQYELRESLTPRSPS